MYTSTAAFLIALLGTATASPLVIVPRQQDFSANTQNGLDGSCKDTIVIFARGTTEGGNVGTIAGPPFFQALSTSLGAGKLAVQGVEYPADIPGFLAGGDATGSKTMATLTEKAVSTCPKSAVIIAGYSQGCQLVHNAAKAMSAGTSSKVAGALCFGDPMNGMPFKGIASDKSLVICHQGDNICEGGSQIKRQHLTYGNDAPQAAKFAATLKAPA